MTGFERSTVRLAQIALGISILAAIFVCLQWWEMHTTGTDTHDLAVHAKEQADKMKDMSEAADKIRLAAENMVTQDQRIADNSQKATEASTKQNKAVLDAAIRQFRDDQRAWVAAVSPSVEGFEVDAFTQGKITWINSGKTFAKRAYPSVHLRFTPTMMTTNEDLDRAAKAAGDAEESSIGVLAPQGRSESVLKREQKLSAVEKSAFSSWYTFLWGELIYYDVFGRRHTTEFCSYRKGIVGDFLQCPCHNDAD